MSDEYLWDKTGNDPDIERLEKALASYHYRETPAPRLPVIEAVQEKRGPFFFKLSMAFAGAACLVLIAVLAVWLGMIRRTQTPEVAQTKSVNAPIGDKKYESTPADSIPTKPSIPAPVKISAPPRRLPKDQIRNTLAKRNLKRGPVQLTKDEQYAYEQLKLALWIAGTKAKVVQDTIDRVDETKSPSDRNNK